MRNLATIFAVVLVVAFSYVANAAEQDKKAYAEQIVKKTDMTQASVAISLPMLTKKYSCLDNKSFKDEYIRLNEEAAKTINVDANFAAFLVSKADENELKNMNDALDSADGKAYLDDLKNPKFKANGELYFPSLEKTKDVNLKKVSSLFGQFAKSKDIQGTQEQLKENLAKLNALISPYLEQKNGQVQCKQQPIAK